jgi:hypothetical protein
LGIGGAGIGTTTFWPVGATLALGVTWERVTKLRMIGVPTTISPTTAFCWSAVRKLGQNTATAPMIAVARPIQTAGSIGKEMFEGIN